MTAVGFTCPRCGTRDRWGTGTNPDGSRFHHCNGVRSLPGCGAMTCDFSIPITGHEPARTREQREEALRGILKANEQIAHALAFADLDDELGLRELEASFGQQQSAVVQLIDDIVPSRQESELLP